MRYLRIKMLFFAIGIILSMFSCGNKEIKRNKQLAVLWNKSEKSIDDFDFIYQLAEKYPHSLDSLIDLSKVLVDSKIDKSKLKKLYFNEVIDTTKTNVKVNFFLENSMSMWPYFKGQKDCERTLSKILIHNRFIFGKKNVTFSYITDSIYKQRIDGEVTTFISRLEKDNMNVGNVTNTKIADIINTVIKKTDTENLSILVSDCIYSLSKGKDQKESINFEWALIEESFLDILKENDYSVFIVKYMSNYEGKYYSVLPTGGEKVNKNLGTNTRFERPFYVIAIGETKLVNAVLNGINFSEYIGYENSYLITLPKPADRIDYRILNIFKKGSFRPDKKDYKHTIIKARKGTRKHEKGEFSYTIAANLKDIRVENDYLLNSANYKVTGNYSLGVQKVTEKLIRDYPSLSNYTHLLTLTNTANLREEEIKISLKRKTPQWIYDTHTDDDSKLSKEYQHKTRGFKYLIEGIESAFYQAQKRKSSNNEDNKYYFTLTTKINL